MVPETPVWYRIQYKVWSKVLEKEFVHTEDFRSMADFRLKATSLWSGRWEIITVMELCKGR